MVCPKCGTPLIDGENFCSKCGALVNKEYQSNDRDLENGSAVRKTQFSAIMLILYLISAVLFFLEAMLWYQNCITTSGIWNLEEIHEEVSLSSAFSDELTNLNVISMLASSLLCIWAILSGMSKHRFLVFQKASLIWCFWWFIIELLNILDRYSFLQPDEFGNVVKVSITAEGWMFFLIFVVLCTFLFVMSAKSSKISSS